VRRGYFDEALLRQIADTPNFVVILSPNSLDRCVDEEDWLRREIAQAIRARRNIIPILMPGFTLPRELPPEIRNLSRYQGPEYSHRYFDAMIVEIVDNHEREKAEAQTRGQQEAKAEHRRRELEEDGKREEDMCGFRRGHSKWAARRATPSVPTMRNPPIK